MDRYVVGNEVQNQHGLMALVNVLVQCLTKVLVMLSRYAKIPDEPLGGAMGLEKSTTSSTSGSESSTSSDSESDDSEAERVRKLALLQEQVSLEVDHTCIVEIFF